MTISTTTRKAGPFAGNNVTTSFPFTFKVFADTDLVVVHTDPSEVETTLVLATDYTVTLNPDQDTDPGGTVTLPSALLTGYKLTITSDVPTLQSLELTNGGGFYPAVINDALDRLTILAQQNTEKIGRSVKVPVSSSDDPDNLIDTLLAASSSASVSAASASSSASSASASASSASGSASAAAASAASIDAANLLTKSGNLSGLGSAATARTNLGLGTAATANTGTGSGNVPLVGTKSATDTLAGLVEPRVQIREHAAPTTALAGHHRETPADSSHLGGWCAYCGAIAQAASTILPTPVCIRRGHRDDTFSLPLRTTALATGDRASPFDSRGPPLTS